MLYSQVQKLKEQASAEFMQQYFGEKIPQHLKSAGGFGWNQDDSKAYYQRDLNRLPALNDMWGNYLRAAKSRGVKADYMTFKKMYDEVKKVKQTQFLTHLQNAEARGIPLDKIHDVLRENPDLQQELLNATADGSDVSNQYRAQYNPAPEKSLAQMMADNPATVGLGMVGTAAGADFLFRKPDMTEYNKSLSESEKIKAKANENYSKWEAKNRPMKKDGTFYAKSSKQYKDWAKQKKVKNYIDKHNVKIADAEKMVGDKPKSRYEKWKSKTSSKPGGGFGYQTLLYTAPWLAESGADLLGLDEESAQTVGDVVGLGTGSALMRTAYQIAKNAPGWGKLAALLPLFFGGQQLLDSGGGLLGSTSGPTNSNNITPQYTTNPYQ
tara:strand:- start:512 stop:1654 length:1143 start_codon:yes stop_codon:yes gene_type:complete